MGALSRFSLKNGVAVLILCILVTGLGLYSSVKIKQQTFPDVSFPAVFVQAVYPGASTEEIESEVTKPIEASLTGLKGYDSLTSTSSENMASVFVQYPFGKDMDKITTEVEGALAKVNLPDKAEVKIQRLSAGSQPIYQAAIFSTRNDPEGLQQRLENEVLPKLRQIDGISSVELKGTKSERLDIVVDKRKASEQGISIGAVQSAIEAQNYALPLGSVNSEDNTIPIRLVGKMNAVEQLEQLKLSPGGGQAAANPMGGAAGSPGGNSADGPAAAEQVLLSDIAKVTTVSEQDEISRFNGEESFILSVVKNQDANTADVANAVKDELEGYKDSVGMDVHVVEDQGKEIEDSVSSLIREGLYGALFCVIIIFLFLRNVRATIISILSLPISIFATIAVLDQMGYSLNIMTLGGIAVSIGRIVDDSIVVIENIFRWRQEKGKEYQGKELAYRATKEVIGAVGSSTLAMIVVFLPLAFVSGIIGEFFRPFAVSVVIAIVVSLFVAMMLIPVLGAKFFRNVKEHSHEGALVRFYEKVIRGALKRKAVVLIGAVAILVGSLATIPLLGVSFIPAGSAKTIDIDIALPSGSSLEQTNAAGGKVESYLKEMPGVDNYQATIGGEGGGSPFGGGTGGTANKAHFTVNFLEGTDTEPLIEQATKALTATVQELAPESKVDVKEAAGNGPPSGNNIDVSLYASDLGALAKASAQVEALMKQSADLKDVTNNLKDVTPKWEMTINQAGQDANLSYFQVMQAVGEQLKPADAGTYTLDGKAWDITISYDRKIASKEQLEEISIPTAAGVKQLRDVVEVNERTAPVSVSHDNGKTYAQISATVKGSDTAAVTQTVQKDLESLSLPDGVEMKIGGGLEMINSGFQSILIALAAAIGLVFLVMSVTFGGLRTPLIILSSLLFVPAGSLGALLVTGQTLSMSSMIGMLMLVGIVVTNAVVLLDRVEKNAKSGMPLLESVVEASKTRLRPILMTACATILALVPLAMSQTETSLISGGLAITVIGGLTTSTLLTLIVVPVIYMLTGKKRKFAEENF
ncbi:efflux RND transporter permease subunit [Cohnella suwonensis]|uniref:Efflux RND transporter permease subunit n=1 Tax=Cohnella suwonensis TaxID=696072 RepID=A0ABW0LS02_9BACL